MTIFPSSKIISAKVMAVITGTLCKYTMTLTEELKWHGSLVGKKMLETGNKRVLPTIKKKVMIAPIMKEAGEKC